MQISDETLATARVAGRLAHAGDRPDVPALDTTINTLVEELDLKVGEGAASIFAAFSAGYDQARDAELTALGF